jgi:hypothetical protein
MLVARPFETARKSMGEFGDYVITLSRSFAAGYVARFLEPQGGLQVQLRLLLQKGKKEENGTR